MKKTLTIGALLLCAAALQAQNLNPVVEVTNIYAREATGIEKPEQLLPLPDSVFKFNLDFDYSVKSTPYKGAYEFNPYLVQLRPAARLSNEQRFYFSGGAGYSLHPEAELVWNPLRTKNFRLDVYANHNSYFGQYRNIAQQNGEVTWDGTNIPGTGLRLNTQAGVDMLAAFKGGQFTADLQYANVTATDFFRAADLTNLLHHKAQAQLRVQSNPGTKLLYNVGTRIAYLSGSTEQEMHTVTDASVGVSMGKNNALRVGAGFETVSFDKTLAFKLEIVPHYTLGTKRFNLDLGVKYSLVNSSTQAGYTYKGGILFPDVHLSYRIADAAVLQASATGGDNLQTYDSLLSDNPYVGSFNITRDVTVTRLNAMVGLRGSAGGRFSYDLRGGYRWVDNARGWTYLVSSTGEISPAMCYVSPLHTWYVDLKLAWNSENWDIMGFAHYGITPKPNLETELQKNVFVPSRFNANGHVFYKWGGRIKVGPTIEARGKLKSMAGAIPAYQDLGVYAEYAPGRKLAIWLKGGNLLNQTIQRIPFYAEGGIYGTVGVRIVL